MFSPSSCTKCSRPRALLSPSGLCQECAATDATADATPAERPAPEPGSAAPTATNPPQAPLSEGPTAAPHAATATASAPSAGFSALPESPPGFVLLRHLVEGGMGDVYLARECPSERLVALKFLKRPEHLTAYQRFVNELQTLAELRHPNIVGVLASDFMRAKPFFTMEYAEGGSLSDALKPGPGEPNRFSPREAVRAIRVIAGAVAAANARGIIHRDLKPSNVLLFGARGAWDALKVADFGLAKRLNAEEPETLTNPTDTIGTPGYMPPEQVSRANGDIDCRADVYGLGATLYHVLTGRAPFVGPTVPDTIQQVLADPPTRPRALKPEIPLALEAIVLKCLAKDPADRYQTVGVFLAALDNYEQLGYDRTAPQMTRLRRAGVWVNRNRRRLGAAALTVLIVAGTFWLGLGWGRRWTDENGFGLLAAVTPPLSPFTPPPPLLTTAFTPELTPEQVRGELRGGGRVLLVGARAPRVPLTWGLGNGEVLSTKDGRALFALRSRAPAVLWLLDDPGIEKYRIRAELRQDQKAPVARNKVSATAQAGLVFGHGRRPVGDALVHTLALIEFNEADAEADREIGFSDLACLEQPFQTFTRRHHRSTHIPLAPREPTDKDGDAWRTLDVVVSRTGATLTHHGRTAALTAADFNRFVPDRLDELRGAIPGRPELPRPEWSPRLPIGIWVSESWVSVRNVTIEPAP